MAIDREWRPSYFSHSMQMQIQQLDAVWGEQEAKKGGSNEVAVWGEQEAKKGGGWIINLLFLVRQRARAA